jgi:hypothetical protein
MQFFLVVSALTILTACNGSELNKSAMMSLQDLALAENMSCMENNFHEDQVNEAKSIILPITLARARELITDGALPFGFSMPKDFDREAEFITNSSLLVKLDESHEPKIGVRLEPVEAGANPSTKIIVDTNSTQIVMKGRQHPYAGAILQHTACLYNLFDVQLSQAEKSDTVLSKSDFKNSLPVDLVLARSVSTHHIQLGDMVPFIVRYNVMENNHIIIPKGTRAWGKITTLKSASSFMKSGELAFELSHLDLPGGKKLPLRFRKQEQGEGETSTGSKLAEIGITGGLVMVATVALILPFIDGNEAVMRAGTEITVETGLN